MTSLTQLIEMLRAARGIEHKLDIQQAALHLSRSSVPVGDDCAAISDGDGYLLFAIEGLLAEFVEAEPWFAGYCAVMVNVSDIFAMGGRPTALVDAIWTNSPGKAEKIWQGMNAAAAKYQVPIVGGHTNSRSCANYLAASIVGRAKTLLTSFDAMPGDVLIAAIDLRGEWFGGYPYFNASTSAEGARLREDLEILPRLAERGWCRAAKDISMGGIVGTLTMLAECSNIGATLNLAEIPKPPETAIEKWITAFPSYGFILAVSPGYVASVLSLIAIR